MTNKEDNSGTGILALDLWSRYAISVYWAIVTLSTIGYGDITPKNMNETITAIFIGFLAVILFAFTI